MKKVLTALFLTALIYGTSGCASSRTTVKTDAEEKEKQTEATDSNRTENTSSREQINAIITSDEQKTVVIDFEETEYFQPDSAKNDTGVVKKTRKGTITINGTKQTNETKETTNETTNETKTETAKEVKTERFSHEETSTKEKTDKKPVYVVAGLALALLFVGFGVYIAKKFL